MLLSIAAAAPAIGAPSLVPNADFETLDLDEFDAPVVNAYGDNVPASWFFKETTPAQTATPAVRLIPDDDSSSPGSRSFALNYIEGRVGNITFPAEADIRSYAFPAIAGETLTWSFDYKFTGGADPIAGDEFRADLRFFRDLASGDPNSTGSQFIFEDQYLSGTEAAAPGPWRRVTREFVVPFDSPAPGDENRPAAGTLVYGDVRVSVNAFTFFSQGQVRIDNVSVTRPVSADYNNDGFVNAADYTAWRDTLGSTTMLAADGTGDGVVDQLDYDRWVFEYGSTVGAATAVPEPSAIAFVAAASAAAFRRRRA